MKFAVPEEDVTAGPTVTWKHIDGPLMVWAGSLHWLTIPERIQIFFGLATVDSVGCKRWPHLAKLRAAVLSARLKSAQRDTAVPTAEPPA